MLTTLQDLLKSDRLGSWFACGVWFVGGFSILQKIGSWMLTMGPAPGFLVVAFDGLLAAIVFGLLGVVAALLVEILQKANRLLELRLERIQAGQDAVIWAPVPRRDDGPLSGASDGLPTTSAIPDPGRDRIEQIERAIRAEEWDEAARLLAEFNEVEPEHADIERLGRKLGLAQQAAIDGHLEQLEASRHVNDTARVLEIYERIAPILDDSQRRPLEGDLARWFLELIHRRLRSGNIQAEIVNLSARVSEVFRGTSEGASLRAGLPTLRRSIGLCARCGEPYVGVESACPSCVSASSNFQPATAPHPVKPG